MKSEIESLRKIIQREIDNEVMRLQQLNQFYETFKNTLVTKNSLLLSEEKVLEQMREVKKLIIEDVILVQLDEVIYCYCYCYLLLLLYTVVVVVVIYSCFCSLLLLWYYILVVSITLYFHKIKNNNIIFTISIIEAAITTKTNNKQKNNNKK